ncbi:MAG TPA: hypothetical protein VF982_01795 [Anaerolineales bacterium]
MMPPRSTLAETNPPMSVWFYMPGMVLARWLGVDPNVIAGFGLLGPQRPALLATVKVLIRQDPHAK